MTFLPTEILVKPNKEYKQFDTMMRQLVRVPHYLTIDDPLAHVLTASTLAFEKLTAGTVLSAQFSV